MTKLEDLCQINPEIYNSKKDNWEEINYLDTSNITENILKSFVRLNVKKDKIPSRAKRKVKENDIIFSTVRPSNKHYGILKNLPNNVLVSTGFSVIRVISEKVNPNFIYEYLSQERITSLLHSIGEDSQSSYPAINPNDITSLNIKIPSSNSIKFIGRLSNLIQKKIDINISANNIIDQVSQKLFNSWFVNFDVVRENVRNNSLKQNKKINSLFPGSFEKSHHGEIPKGWSVGSISDLTTSIEKGISPKYTENKNFPVVNQKCVRDLEVNLDLCKFTEYKKIMENKFLNNFDILVNSMGVGTLGRVALFIGRNKKYVVDGCINVVKGTDISSSIYIFQNLLKKTEEIINLSTGSTGQTTLKKEDLGKLKIIIPSKDLINLYSDIVKNLFIKKNINSLEIKKLLLLRKQIFPKLFSGDLEIKNINGF